MTATVLVLGSASASARSLPQYEFAGFPISPLQIMVMGLDGIQQRSADPTLAVNGMPASPHQIAVIGPRTWNQLVERLNKGKRDVQTR